MASDGRWYVSDTPPAPGYVLGPTGRWLPAGDPEAMDPSDAWRGSRWGLGDVWWGVLVFVGASLLVGIAVIAVSAWRGGDVDGTELGPYATSLLVIGNVAAFLGVPWWASRRKGLANLATDFGLHARPIDAAIGFGFGIAGLVVAAIVGAAVDAAFGVDETTTNIPVDALHGAGEIIVFFLAVAVVTPIIEELFFRGLVYRSFVKRGRSNVGSVIRTTLIFVVPHLTAADDLASFVSLAASIAVLGLAFQLACSVTRGRLGAAIVAHGVVNGAAVLALAFG